MARSRASSKAAGTKYETDIARYFHVKTGKQVIRMPKFGAWDRGDVFGVTHMNDPVVVECKSPGQGQSYKVSQWIREVKKEKEKSDSPTGILLIKRFRKKIGQSLCVICEHDAVMYGIPIDTIPVCSTRSFLNWWEFVEEHTYARFPIRGCKNEHYVVTYLDTIIDVFDKNKPVMDIVLTDNQRHAISQGKTVTIAPPYPGAPTVNLVGDDDTETDLGYGPPLC